MLLASHCFDQLNAGKNIESSNSASDVLSRDGYVFYSFGIACILQQVILRIPGVLFSGAMLIMAVVLLGAVLYIIDAISKREIRLKLVHSSLLLSLVLFQTIFLLQLRRRVSNKDEAQNHMVSIFFHLEQQKPSTINGPRRY